MAAENPEHKMKPPPPSHITSTHINKTNQSIPPPSRKQSRKKYNSFPLKSLQNPRTPNTTKEHQNTPRKNLTPNLTHTESGLKAIV